MRLDWLFMLPEGEPDTQREIVNQWLAADPVAAEIPVDEVEAFVSVAWVMRYLRLAELQRLFQILRIPMPHNGEKGRRRAVLLALRRWKAPGFRKTMTWYSLNVGFGHHPDPANYPDAWTDERFVNAMTEINILWLAHAHHYLGRGDGVPAWLEVFGEFGSRTYEYWISVGRLTIRKLVYGENEQARSQQEAAAGQATMDQLRKKDRQSGALRHAVRRLEQDRKALRRNARQAELKARALLAQARSEVAAARRALLETKTRQAQEVAEQSRRFEAELAALQAQQRAARADFVRELSGLAAEPAHVLQDRSVCVSGAVAEQEIYRLLVESLGGRYAREEGTLLLDGAASFLAVEQALRDLALQQVVIKCDGLYRRKEGRYGLAIAGFQICLGTAAEAIGASTRVVNCGPLAGSLMAEYGGLVMGLRWLAIAGPPPGARLEIRSDCRTMVRRLTAGRSARRKPGCISLDETARRLLRTLRAQGCAVDLHWVPREEVYAVDRQCARTYFDQDWYHRVDRKTRIPLQRFMGSAAPALDDPPL